MPYVKPELRTPLEFLNPMPSNAGELNYAISHLVHRYVIETKKGVSYANVNEAMGVMICATFEFYRTVVAPYENQKAIENGPVSELDKPFFEALGTTAPGMVVSSPASIHEVMQGFAEMVAQAVQQPAPAKRRSKKEPAIEPAKTAAAASVSVSPATGDTPLKPGETRVLTGPIPGDIPGGKPATTAVVKRPQGPRVAPPGPNASAGERALHALAEGADDEF